MSGVLTCSRCSRRGIDNSGNWHTKQVPTMGGGSLDLALCPWCQAGTEQAIPAGQSHDYAACPGDAKEGERWEAHCNGHEGLGDCAFRHACWDEECTREAASDHEDEESECETCGQEVDHEVRVRRVGVAVAAVAS